MSNHFFIISSWKSREIDKRTIATKRTDKIIEMEKVDKLFSFVLSQCGSGPFMLNGRPLKKLGWASKRLEIEIEFYI